MKNNSQISGIFFAVMIAALEISIFSSAVSFKIIELYFQKNISFLVISPGFYSALASISAKVVMVPGISIPCGQTAAQAPQPMQS